MKHNNACNILHHFSCSLLLQDDMIFTLIEASLLAMTSMVDTSRPGRKKRLRTNLFLVIQWVILHVWGEYIDRVVTLYIHSAQMQMIKITEIRDKKQYLNLQFPNFSLNPIPFALSKHKRQSFGITALIIKEEQCLKKLFCYWISHSKGSKEEIQKGFISR